LIDLNTDTGSVWFDWWYTNLTPNN
jgi:hypothetical protein